jgi:hypothetical protein
MADGQRRQILLGRSGSCEGLHELVGRRDGGDVMQRRQLVLERADPVLHCLSCIVLSSKPRHTNNERPVNTTFDQRGMRKTNDLASAIGYA